MNFVRDGEVINLKLYMKKFHDLYSTTDGLDGIF